MIYKTKSGEGHHHLFFVPEGTDEAISTESNGHTHRIRIVHGVAYVDHNEVDLVEDGESHSHEVVEVKNTPPAKIPKTDDDEVVAEVHALFREAYNINIESFEDAIESEEFYQGDQWDERDKKTLEHQGRACLTINESGAQMDTLLGYQRNNRSDFKFLPIEGSDARVGYLLDRVVKVISENNNYVFEESGVAEDQYIAGKGNFAVYMDYDNNLEGDITIERVSWRDIFYGPYEKMDRSDCEFLVKQKMFSKERLKRMFPDHADELQKDYNVWQTRKEKLTVSGMEYSEMTGQLTIGDTDFVMMDIQKKEYRLLELWRKQFRTEYVLVDLMAGSVENITGVDKKIRNQLDKSEQYKVVARTVYDIRVTKTAGPVLLSDEIEEMADDDFDVVPVHAKYKNGKWWGKMHELKDVQREINHRHSQVVDIVNKSISYMWMIDGDTFSSPADEQDFLDRATEPGFVAKIEDIEKPPFQVQGGKVPVEVVQLMNISTEKLFRISNVPQETQGDSKMQLSGVAIREKVQVALQSNRHLFDNMNLSKKLVAKKIVALVKKYYTPERIIRLIRDNTPSGDPRDQEINNLDDQAIMKLLQDNDLMKYDIQVDQSPYSPTMRMANQIVLQELMGQGAPVPFEYFIEQSDMPDKERMLALFQEQRQQQQQAEQEKNQTERYKAELGAMGRGQGGQPPAGPGGPQ